MEHRTKRPREAAPGGSMFFIIEKDSRERAAEARSDEPMSRTLFREGFYVGVPLCAGFGRCGLCRARYLSAPPEPLPSEIRRLSPDELAAGWRLSCLRPAAPGARIELPNFAYPVQSPAVAKDFGNVISRDHGLALGLDLGTTGLSWRAVSLKGKHEIAAHGEALNPQLGAGGEVMSRLAYARTPEGADHLRGLILDHLRSVAASLPGRLENLSVAGNPAMTAILLGLDLKGLSAAPYHLPYLGGETRPLADDLPPAYIPPALSPFVGGDLTAGLAVAVLERKFAYPFLLADLGTNGEFILALSPDTFLAASVPMGPALEGVGLRNGRMASKGAAVGFSLSPLGLVPELYKPEGREEGAPFSGIAGTGYLSLIAKLLATGAMGADGRFSQPGAPGLTPLGARILSNLQTGGSEPWLDLGGAAFFASDAEEILKVKSAFNLAMGALFLTSGLAPGDLSVLALAGALGRHVRPEDLEDLGFLPPGLGGRVRAVGNSSLDGACLLLLSPDARAFVSALPEKSRTLDLTRTEDFQTAFAARMVFRHVP